MFHTGKIDLTKKLIRGGRAKGKKHGYPMSKERYLAQLKIDLTFEEISRMSQHKLKKLVK
jgi:hypothetical protein